MNLPTNDLRNFNKKKQKSGFLQDEILGELEFKVANIALYYKNQDKLVEHIKEVNLRKIITSCILILFSVLHAIKYLLHVLIKSVYCLVSILS